MEHYIDLKTRVKGMSSSGEWYTGNLVYIDNTRCIIPDNTDVSVPVIDNSIGNFTGYKTTEGDEIFTNDIIEYKGKTYLVEIDEYEDGVYPFYYLFIPVDEKVDCIIIGSNYGDGVHNNEKDYDY